MLLLTQDVVSSLRMKVGMGMRRQNRVKNLEIMKQGTQGEEQWM